MQAHNCQHCGESQDVDVPADHDGQRIIWECPGCGGRNVIEGWNPTTRAIDLANGIGDGFRDIVMPVHDGDDGSATDDIV